MAKSGPSSSNGTECGSVSTLGHFSDSTSDFIPIATESVNQEIARDIKRYQEIAKKYRTINERRQNEKRTNVNID
jgi:hypothetical protein